MNTDLLKVALSHGALYFGPSPAIDHGTLREPAAAFAASLARCGYVLAPDALGAANASVPNVLQQIVDVVEDVYGIGLNWAPLVKGWTTPTGESAVDHLVTLFANLFPDSSIPGTTLPCGHFIPFGTFPLDRYNGCPFCGTPFTLSGEIYTGQGSRAKVLELWREADLIKLRDTLVQSAVPLDATRIQQLRVLAYAFGPGDIRTVVSVENAFVVASILEDKGMYSEAAVLIDNPSKLIRYLWYRHTGQLRIVRPASVYGKIARNYADSEARVEAVALSRRQMSLHYTRSECRRYADWLENMNIEAAAMCEMMNPRRQMWVRFIRALRLTEFAKNAKYPKLRTFLDLFYRKDYPVWLGKLESSKLRNDSEAFFRRLSTRPGLFARSLFASMLWFGPGQTLENFLKISLEIPPRLLISLSNAAVGYFMPDGDKRYVELPGGKRVAVPVNKLLSLYAEEKRMDMAVAVKGACLEAVGQFFASVPHTSGRRVYIAPSLFDIPVPVGDRAATVQDASAAYQGERFKVEGNEVRLFLQWGKGLPAQHLDMDLSAAIIYADGTSEECAYYSLSLPGACHSDDIRHIPDLVGTAEYIELDINELLRNNARYAVFTCNAYTDGSLDPGLIVGWMDSANPMKVSDESGVAYDPSTVSHFVKVSAGNLSKGLVFGVLDIAKREILWVEMPFDGRSVASLSLDSVQALVHRLESKISVGELIAIMADAQGLVRTDSPADADISYTSRDSVLEIL
ncbi:MAG: hypothetical protein HDS65_09120 [Bacteroidales bacterium]|nr:hypothetical protein [Bacteroidales bacterium]